MAKRKPFLKSLFVDHKAIWISSICGIVASFGAQMIAAYFKSSPTPAFVTSGTNINHAVLIAGKPSGNISSDDHSKIAQQLVSIGNNNYAPINANQTVNIGADSNKVEQLSDAITNLNDKTADIETLPDGRTIVGGNILTGTPRNIYAEINDGGKYYNDCNFSNALKKFKEAISFFENKDPAEGKYAMFISTNPFNNQTKGYCYLMAAYSNLGLGSNIDALTYAEKAVAEEPIVKNYLALSRSETILGVESLSNKQYGKGFDFSVKGVNAYESAKSAGCAIIGIRQFTNTNGKEEYEVFRDVDILMGSNEVSRLYHIGALSAWTQSSNSLAIAYCKKAIAADSSNTNALAFFHQLQTHYNFTKYP